LFSRADAETANSIDVRDVLESTLRMARNEIRHRAVLVKQYDEVPHVRASDSRLGQVFLNLLINAAQAIPEGHADRNEIRVHCGVMADGQVLVEIADTGCGIPEELGRQLFAPFVTTKPVGVGTGLGLAICQRIVAGLGGTISFDSELQRGTVFRVVLPAESELPVPVRTPSVARPPTRRGRILLIDDETSLGTLLVRALKPAHDVTYFADARKALDHLRREPEVDVILCDLMMPVMTGVEFYQELSRALPEQATRVVFLTGGAFTPGARGFLESVGNVCLEKPLDLARVRKLINELVG
jgi:two-component system cell cycle sensor histidine kinase/response regulator CckA